MWGVLLQMMECVLNGMEPSIYSPTRLVHGDLNLVGGETVICMPPCNCLKKVGLSCCHGGAPTPGCGRTTGGPLATAFTWSVRLWALILPVVSDGSSLVFWWVFPFIFDLRVFWIRFLEVCFLVSFAPFHVAYLKLIFAIKLVERLVQSCWCKSGSANTKG